MTYRIWREDRTMKNKRYAKNPLLYIHQPDVGTPTVPMQSNYRTSKNLTASKTDNQEGGRKMKRRPQRRHGGRPVHEIKEVEDTPSESVETNEKVRSEQPRSKKFKEMSLLEKVKYFASEPTHVPKIKCEIKTTTDKSYRGIIVDFDEETVFMRMGRRVNMREIPFKDIERIRMLGF